MSFLFDLPLPTRSVQTYFFTGPVDNSNLGWQAWTCPLGVSMLNIICIGGGGGGGGGLTRNAGVQGRGGGGGGSSGMSKLIIPAIYLRKTLYVQVGSGGGGGTAGSPGGSGGTGVRSYVAIAPDIVSDNVLLVSGANGATGGAGAPSSGGAGGVNGAAGTIATASSCPRTGIGLHQFFAGSDGSTGGFDANGTGIAFQSSGNRMGGGSGGAGHIDSDRAGGAFTAVANTYVSEQRPATPAAGTDGHGSGGIAVMKPFYMFGGGGGSCSNASTGANGGHGINGSGGGGGGSGTTGGRGGNGGNGLVIIQCW